MRLSEPYRPRAIRFLDRWNVGGFRVKVYGIAYQGDSPEAGLCEAAQRVTAQCLAENAISTVHYGVGFVGIHEGRDGNFVFVDWWVNENELHHHVYMSKKEDPLRLEDKTAAGIVACVWDLYVMSFERNAWVECVLKRFQKPGIDEYLSTAINTSV